MSTTTTRTALAFYLLTLAGLSGACDPDACATLVYVDLDGPTAAERTAILSTMACSEKQDGLALVVGPTEAHGKADQWVALPALPAGQCWQVGAPALQWGVEFVPAALGPAAPWNGYHAALVKDGALIEDAMSWPAGTGVQAGLKVDAFGEWHPVKSYGGDCSPMLVP